MASNSNDVSSRHARVTPAQYVLRIGVTGHRTLNDEARIRATVEELVQRVDRTLRQSVEEPRSAATSKRDLRDWFDRSLLVAVSALWRTMPITPGHVPRERQVPLQWRVTSALAKGADQIVADVIMKDAFGELHAVLPFAREDYARDFEGPDLQRFHELADAAAKTTVTSGGDGAEPADRDQGYRRAGECVVDNSDILIAVWDGAPARGDGGTGEIVRYAFRKGVPVYWIDAENPAHAPRLLEDEADLDKEPRPLPKTAKEIALRYHQLCAYYRAPAFSEAAFSEIYDRERKRLNKEMADAELSSPSMESAITRHLDDYAYADQLAIRHQQLLRRCAKTIIVFAALAVTSAALHLLVFKHQYWLIGLEIAFMAGAGVLLRVCIREGWHEKWLNNRYLAERLRNLMFREGLGHPPLESNSLKDMHPFYEGPAAWVDRILRAEGPAPASTQNDLDPIRVRKFLDLAWIGNQADWHEQNVGKKRRAHHRYHRATLALFWLTLLCAALHLLHFGEPHSAFPIPGVPELIKILAVTLPAWGGAVHGIAHLMDHSRVAEQSRRMHGQLKNLVYELGQAEDVDAIAVVAERADKLMALESSEWMMTLAYRKPELHV